MKAIKKFILISVLVNALGFAFSEESEEVLSLTDSNSVEDTDGKAKTKKTSDKSKSKEKKPVVNFWTPEQKWSITEGMSVEDGTDYVLDQVGLDLTTVLDMNEFNVSWGGKISGQTADLTAKIVYMPTFFGCFGAGFGTVFHSQFYSHEYCELDLLNGLYLRYDRKKFFSAQADVSYHYKAACIYEIRDYVPWLKNHTLALHCGVGFNIKDFAKITFDFSSYSYYRYFLYFAPDFKLASRFNINKYLDVGAEVECQYIDMFTLSANFNSFDGRAFVTYKF